jgi:RNA polymerase sigma factor (sigma-70 family)
MAESASVQDAELMAWRIQKWLQKVAQGCACEHEKESLANWLLEMCLYYAHLERSNDPQEIAVLAAERLWESIQSSNLTWRDDAGLKGLLHYIHQAVRFEMGRYYRQLQRDRAICVSLESITHLPDPNDLEQTIIEKLNWELIKDVIREAIQHLSPQQKLVVLLRLDGLEPREIAELVQLSRKQVNVVLSQAYARLRHLVFKRAESHSALAAALDQVFNIRPVSETKDDDEGT